MGAWGVDTFENDAACDWTARLEKAKDLGVVEKTLDRVLAAGSKYLDSDDAARGLAACEVVARLKGKWGARSSYTERVDAWVEAHPLVPGPKLVARALAVIDRVAGADSELAELWEDNRKWRAKVKSLRERVGG